jgi:hypothetical protein
METFPSFNYFSIISLRKFSGAGRPPFYVIKPQVRPAAGFRHVCREPCESLRSCHFGNPV